jgi:hypothetical protein
MVAGLFVPLHVDDDHPGAAAHERVTRDRRAGLHRFLSDFLPVLKFLSLLIPDEATVFPDVKVISRHWPAY